jgi:hypothetical protein
MLYSVYCLLLRPTHRCSRSYSGRVTSNPGKRWQYAAYSRQHVGRTEPDASATRESLYPVFSLLSTLIGCQFLPVRGPDQDLNLTRRTRVEHELQHVLRLQPAQHVFLYRNHAAALEHRRRPPAEFVQQLLLRRLPIGEAKVKAKVKPDSTSTLTSTFSVPRPRYSRS